MRREEAVSHHPALLLLLEDFVLFEEIVEGKENNLEFTTADLKTHALSCAVLSHRSKAINVFIQPQLLIHQ